MAAEDLSKLSIEELQKELAEQNKRRKELQKRIKEKKDAEVKRLMQRAEKRTLSEREMGEVRDAFSTFDKDGSGTIDIMELWQVAQSLGCDLSDAAEREELMQTLDTDKDGVVSFDEFLEWWCSDHKLGGNKGVKLGLMKAKLLANSMKKDFERFLEKTGTERVRPMGNVTMQSMTFNLAVGEVPEPKTTIEAFILPSTPDQHRNEVEKILPEGYSYVTIDDDDAQYVRFAVEADLLLKKGVTKAEVEQTIREIQPVLDSLRDAAGDRLELVVESTTDSTGGPKVVVRAFIKMDRLKDPFLQTLAGIIKGTADEAEHIMPDIFSNISMLFHAREATEDVLRWDSDRSLIDLFDNMKLQFHGELSSSVHDIFLDFVSRYTSDTSTFPAQVFLAANLFAFISADMSLRYTSLSDVAHDMLNKLLDRFVELAKKKQRDEGDDDDEVMVSLEKEVQQLRELIPTKGVEALGDYFSFPLFILLGLSPIPMALALKGFKSSAREQHLPKVATCVDGLSSIRFMSPMFSAKIVAEGLRVGQVLRVSNLRKRYEDGLDAINESKSSRKEWWREKFPAVHSVWSTLS